MEYENQVLQQMVLESFANFYGQISNDYLESITQSDQAITEGVEDLIDAEANMPITRMALESSDAIVKDMLLNSFGLSRTTYLTINPLVLKEIN